MRTDLIVKSLDALKEGLTILYPTDTIWGIGCDATVTDAVERIYGIKERDHAKSMLVLISEEMLSPTLPAEARDLLLMSERPTTVIIPAEMLDVAVATNLPASDGTIGVRVPRHAFCQELLHQLGHPIVSTSANLSGCPSPASYEDIAEDIHRRVDCDLPDDPSFHHASSGSSRIVKLSSNGEVVVLR